MASDKAKELVKALAEEVYPDEDSAATKIDAAVAPLLDALQEWVDADEDKDWGTYEAKVKALLRAWGRQL